MTGLYTAAVSGRRNEPELAFLNMFKMGVSVESGLNILKCPSLCVRSRQRVHHFIISVPPRTASVQDKLLKIRSIAINFWQLKEEQFCNEER